MKSLDLRQTALMMPYKINFSKMTQTRHETGKKRQIQRLPGPSPVPYLQDPTGSPVTPSVQALIGASKGLRPVSGGSGGAVGGPVISGKRLKTAQ